MNRLEKLKKEKWLLFSEGLKHFENASFESVYGNGWSAASAEYEKIIAELEAALKDCKINAMNDRGEVYVALYPKAEKALEKLKNFRGGE